MTLLLMTAVDISLTDSSTAKPEMSSTDCSRTASENGKRMVQAGASDLADKISDSVLSLLDIAGYNYAQSHGCGRLLSFGSESAKKWENSQTDCYTTHFGRSLAAIYVAGTVLTVRASGNSWTNAALTIISSD